MSRQPAQAHALPQRSPLILSGMTRPSSKSKPSPSDPMAATEPAHFERDDFLAYLASVEKSPPQRSPLILSGMTSFTPWSTRLPTTCRNGARSF